MVGEALLERVTGASDVSLSTGVNDVVSAVVDTAATVVVGTGLVIGATGGGYDVDVVTTGIENINLMVVLLLLML